MPDTTIRPIEPSAWEDLVDLFGPERGASSGCWCMSHRLTGRPAWDALGAEGRKAAFKSVVETGPSPGLLAYDGPTAIGWVAVAPRSDLPRFQTQKVSASVGSEEATIGASKTVFVISCFYVRPGYRKRGLMRPLTCAAIDHARARGASMVEACPIETDKPLVWGEGFVGIAGLFRDLGFTEVARRSPRRPLMQLVLEG